MSDHLYSTRNLIVSVLRKICLFNWSFETVEILSSGSWKAVKHMNDIQIKTRSLLVSIFLILYLSDGSIGKVKNLKLSILKSGQKYTNLHFVQKNDVKYAWLDWRKKAHMGVQQLVQRIGSNVSKIIVRRTQIQFDLD